LEGTAIIRVELHNYSNNLVKVLSGAKNASYHEVLNSDGAGTFLIHRADSDVAALSILSGGIDGYIVHLLRKGPLETAFTDRFSFVVESVSFGLDESEEGGAWITIAGRGTLCLLEDRMAYPTRLRWRPSVHGKQSMAGLHGNGRRRDHGRRDYALQWALRASPNP